MKQQLLEIWQSRTFQVGMDICRILLLVVAIMIFYKLASEIESVKLLNNDPCKVCMNKTGATCFYQWDVDAIDKTKDMIPTINFSNWSARPVE